MSSRSRKMKAGCPIVEKSEGGGGGGTGGGGGYHFPDWAYKAESSPGSRQIQLWHFILELLQKEEFQHVIAWQQGEYGEFVIKDPDEVARLWGRRKCKPQMNYDKLSRALRYYYNKRILHKTKGKRFTYKFNFNKLVMPNYPFINLRPTGVVPQSAPPAPTASSRFHFPPLDGHSPGKEAQAHRFPGRSLGASSGPEALLNSSGGSGSTANGGLSDPASSPAPEREGSSPDWRCRGVDLMAPRGASANAAAQGGPGHPKRKPDLVLPLFGRAGLYPDPHSPFTASPLAGRGVLNMPLSPALSLTPTLFSYSPSPGMSPFGGGGGSCFTFSPEEMNRYLHSQACSVFNYHLSPRTFPRFPGLILPPFPCPQGAPPPPPPEDQPTFPIKLQPPPVGRKHRERAESGGGAVMAGRQALPDPPQIKTEPVSDPELESQGSPPRDPGERDAKREEEEEEEEEWGPPAVFARPVTPSWPLASPPHSKANPPAGAEKTKEAPPSPQEPPGEPPGAPPEKKEDALMPPKLRLKRRWNGDRRAEEEGGLGCRKPFLDTPHILLAPKATLDT